MKKLLIGLLAFWSLSAFAGKTLTCDAPDSLSILGWGSGSDESFLVRDTVYADCYDKDQKEYKMAMHGHGLGLRYGVTSFLVHCPTVRKKRFDEGFTLVGPKVSVEALVGGSVALAVNAKGGVCAFVGLDFGVGASVTISKIQFKPGSLSESDTFDEAWE